MIGYDICPYCNKETELYYEGVDGVAIRKELLRKAEVLYRFVKAEKKEEYNRLLDFEKGRIADLEEGIKILGEIK